MNHEIDPPVDETTPADTDRLSCLSSACLQSKYAINLLAGDLLCKFLLCRWCPCSTDHPGNCLPVSFDGVIDLTGDFTNSIRNNICMCRCPHHPSDRFPAWLLVRLFLASPGSKRYTTCRNRGRARIRDSEMMHKPIDAVRMDQFRSVCHWRAISTVLASDEKQQRPQVLRGKELTEVSLQLSTGLGLTHNHVVINMNTNDEVDPLL